MKKYTVLHISGDYPDPIRAGKTKAVMNLVEGTPDFRHIVYSINRVNGLSGLRVEEFGEHRAIEYKALPKGLFWRGPLNAIAEWIIRDVKGRGLKPDIIEAHKLTIDGVVALKVADELGVPLACDIMGNTDCRLFQRKLDFRTTYQEILDKSAVVFPYAPWAQLYFEKRLQLDPEKCITLPVITHIDELHAGEFVSDDKLLTIFHLHGWKNKNIRRVLAAIKTIKTSRPGIHLDIIGDGSEADKKAVHQEISGAGLQDSVSLLGHIDNAQLPELFKNYAAFVMPSIEETYGQVYAEALCHGLPILFSKDRGIDGFFDAEDIGYACDPLSEADVQCGIIHLLDNQESLKAKIADLQKQGAFDIIRKDHILKTYQEALLHVLGKSVSASAA